MQQPPQIPSTMQISGNVVASGVSFEQYLEQFQGEHVEWVHGWVIQMSPVTERHDALIRFLENLFQALLELTGGGRVLRDPMVMRLGKDLPARQPDLQVLLPRSLHRLKPTYVDGPADLAVEVISEDSERRDRIEKFTEYERGGVPEYWILDPTRKDSLFYVLGPSGLYQLREPDADGIYRSPVFDRLRLPVDLLWREPLPGLLETVSLVQSMLREP